MTGRNKFWGVFRDVSEMQVEFVVNMRMYRRKHNISQAEFTHICNLYGKPSGVKFYPNEISAYENFDRTPRKPKFQVLCNVLNMNPTINKRR